MTDECQLAVAEQHVAEGEQVVARQLQAITRLRIQGLDTTVAEQTLALFEKSLKSFRRHRDSILRTLGCKAS